MRILIVAILSMFLVACGGMPKHAETRTDQPTAVVFIGLPAGADIWVDGQNVFGAEEGRLSIPVSAGMHTVSVRLGSSVIYEREVFVDEGTTREISVR